MGFVGSSEGYDGGESDDRKEGGWAPIVAGCYTSPIFQTTEHNFDAASPRGESPSNRIGSLGDMRIIDAGLDVLGLKSVAEPVSVVATVAEQLLCLGQFVEECGGASIAADVPGYRREAQLLAVRSAMSCNLAALV